MREWPILFRARLVKANREGRKDVTRRLSPKWAEAKPGDLIVVRETWRADTAWDRNKPRDIGRGAMIWYEADGEAPGEFGKLRPSIFLPRWASRDTYPIVSVRQERLQDITEDEARREGFSSDPVPARVNGKLGHVAFFDPLHWYAHTWEAINGAKAPWRSNPTVYVVTYENSVKP
ncbi:MAG: hypothetical protein EPN98_21750 [Phenylobacterium sp.]|uniref:hypothetical protein n=1 Tax=Phenylobacterium sp. TaxID=1871053 RepID=UPI00121684DC|nr:hypothetical protein [Phenylobacterium sp.]TAL29069.1 MAG: hypothetical protein EPN98_21750 [Phenylobacterium sp.]